MAPLPCASVSDLYGSNFGLSAEQIAQQTLKNNQQCAEDNLKYQQGLKENQIAGKANFQENFPQSTFGNSNGNITNIPPMTNQSNNNNNNNNLRNSNFGPSSTTIGPNPAPISENHSQFARRPAWSGIHNKWPSNQGISMFNRFQDIFGTRENFGELAGTDSDYLRQLVNIAHNIELVLKIIMFIIILLFIIKLLEKKNS